MEAALFNYKRQRPQETGNLLLDELRIPHHDNPKDKNRHKFHLSQIKVGYLLLYAVVRLKQTVWFVSFVWLNSMISLLFLSFLLPLWLI